MTIVYTETDPSEYNKGAKQTAIKRDGTTANPKLERLLIDVTTHADATDHRSAIDISFTASGDYTGMGVLTLNDVEIRTDSVGFAGRKQFHLCH
jgi:hypothetical protein